MARSRTASRRTRPEDQAGGPSADRSAGAQPRTRAARSWPLLVLAAPAGAEVWSGWVGIAQKTGFGRVSPLPGIWPSLHLDTSTTLPVGVEAYAAYALRAWLDTSPAVSDRARQFARRSAISSFALGMAGQVAYHHLAQSGAARAPWPVTTIVSCLPVLVLAIGTALAHMLRADAADAPARPPAPQSPECSPEDQARPSPDKRGALTRTSPPAGTVSSLRRDRSTDERTARPSPQAAPQQIDRGRPIARRLAVLGKPVSRRRRKRLQRSAERPGAQTQRRDRRRSHTQSRVMASVPAAFDPLLFDPAALRLRGCEHRRGQ